MADPLGKRPLKDSPPAPLYVAPLRKEGSSFGDGIDGMAMRFITMACHEVIPLGNGH